MHLDYMSLRENYADLGKALLIAGTVVAPRGEPTIEVLGCSFTLHDPKDSLPLGTGRGVVKALAAEETLQVAGGLHDPESLARAAPHFASFLGPDGRQRAAYGPRLRRQMTFVEETLREDPSSRRAQATIWTPELDSIQGLHDYPCTTSLQFFARGGLLHMQVHMRSNDFWLGVPYDVFQFTQIQLAMANVLDLGVGPYRHHAASLHVYEKHWEKLDGLHAPTAPGPPAYGLRGGTWAEVAARAASIQGGALPDDPSVGEKWLYVSAARS